MTSTKPAGYIGLRIIPMDHSDANSCSAYHASTLTTWMCYTCHDPGEVINELHSKGLGVISNCLRCHPTGD